MVKLSIKNFVRSEIAYYREMSFYLFLFSTKARVFLLRSKDEEVEEQLVNAWGGWEGGVLRRDLVVCFVLYR